MALIQRYFETTPIRKIDLAGSPNGIDKINVADRGRSFLSGIAAMRSQPGFASFAELLGIQAAQDVDPTLRIVGQSGQDDVNGGQTPFSELAELLGGIATNNRTGATEIFFDDAGIDSPRDIAFGRRWEGELEPDERFRLNAANASLNPMATQRIDRERFFNTSNPVVDLDTPQRVDFSDAPRLAGPHMLTWPGHDFAFVTDITNATSRAEIDSAVNANGATRYTDEAIALGSLRIDPADPTGQVMTVEPSLTRSTFLYDRNRDGDLGDGRLELDPSGNDEIDANEDQIAGDRARVADGTFALDDLDYFAGSDAFSINGNRNSRRFEPGGREADGLANEYDEQLAIIAQLHNTTDVRSDVYAAWFVVRGYRDQDTRVGRDEPMLPFVERRFLMVLDRSNVVGVDDRAEVLLFRELPIE